MRELQKRAAARLSRIQHKEETKKFLREQHKGESNGEAFIKCATNV